MGIKSSNLFSSANILSRMKSKNKKFKTNSISIKYKKKTPQSTLNKTWFKACALFIYRLMLEANTDKLGNKIGTKKKISKRDLCIYIAQHNKQFRKVYLLLKPNKKYPRADQMKEREEIGLDFYHNVVVDNRRNKELETLWKGFPQEARKDKHLHIRISDGAWISGKRKTKSFKI